MPSRSSDAEPTCAVGLRTPLRSRYSLPRLRDIQQHPGRVEHSTIGSLIDERQGCLSGVAQAEIVLPVHTCI